MKNNWMNVDDVHILHEATRYWEFNFLQFMWPGQIECVEKASSEIKLKLVKRDLNQRPLLLQLCNVDSVVLDTKSCTSFALTFNLINIRTN